MFEFLNQTVANPFFDAVLPWWREKIVWVPAYLLAAFLLWQRFGTVQTLLLLVSLGLTLTVCDQLAASLLKPWVGQLRPCKAVEFGFEARVLVPCGGQYSFPSNHATNHFAVAGLLALTWLRHYGRGWTLLVFVWATSISLAQVYVGKHWPSDIVAGAALGLAGGVAGAALFYALRNRFYRPAN